MTFLSPAAFWTLAALALPLAIHLWRRPPRTVLLGSLRFLQTRPRRLQSLRWREHALLATRLGLLTALALLLARPFWNEPTPVRPARWALLDPAAAPAGPSLDRLRALQAAGSETRALVPGFPLVNAPRPDPAAPAPDAWSLLREADATLPTGSTLAVFSPGRLDSLQGVRPSLAHVRVEWIETPAAGAPAPSPAPSAAGDPLPVLILHDVDRAEDARYVRAALQAVTETGGLPLTVKVATTKPPFAPARWVFWLSAGPVPAALAAQTANIFADADTTALPETSPGWIVPQPGAPGAETLTVPVRLWKRGVLPLEGSVIWTDGFGQGLLTRTHDAHGTRWHFASRFDPAWNDLPLGSALSAVLRALLNTAPPMAVDKRIADPSQCLPSDAPTAVPARVRVPGESVDGRVPLAMLAALLFCLERFLSHRRPARQSSPAAATPLPVPTR